MTNLNISTSVGNRRRFSRTMSSMALSASGIALLAGNEVLAANVGANAVLNAYLATKPAIKDGELVKITGHLVADDTMQWTILSTTPDTSVSEQTVSVGV
ncbi:hypothetical protein H8L32_16325 [Undibacterium sp. CY18W]|uniref:Uncharacterized protein n=1 Tax=Undibacterium hunanense TaxID=2762292 RepID=A0ABR6ZTA6_9BURK|nr:hypothetical protein [Undibacterium hunanense]MBC3919059.1 hypothetical protein [Undibacterium hunanense]